MLQNMEHRSSLSIRKARLCSQLLPPSRRGNPIQDYLDQGYPNRDPVDQHRS